VDRGQHVEHRRQVVDQREVDPLRLRRHREAAVGDEEVVGVTGAGEQLADAGWRCRRASSVAAFAPLLDLLALRSVRRSR